MSLSGTKTAYSVWDRGTRVFHWVNFLAVLGLIGIGTVILYAKPLQVGVDGKILLKTWHVYFGYVFALNLLWRFIWASIGGKFARWNALLPGGKGYLNSCASYLRSFAAGDPKRYLGHNPIARAMISLILILLLVQAVTGLILAGTDVYMPPFGSQVAEWVTNGDEEKLAQLKPGSKVYVDAEAYAEMRRIRKPVVTTHLYTFYALLVLIFLHIVAVVLSEIRERNGLISAMFTGEKWFKRPPE